MKTMMSANKTSRVLGALLVAGLGVFAGLRVTGRPAAVSAPTDPTRIAAAYQNLPLSFEPNQGQAPKDVRFSARGDGYGLYLTSTEAILAMHAREKGSSTSALVRMKLENARKDARATGMQRLPGVSNYFLGKDRSQWRTNVPNFAQVKYEGVYPGIDLVYYGNQRKLEYDFVVAPGADPSQIKLAFQGADRVSIDRSGDLVLDVDGRTIRQHKPVIYQENGGGRKPVGGGYTLLAKNEVGFTLGEYDRTQPLVIDPVLSYSGYVGGGDRDIARNVVVDADGNAYFTGLTFSNNYPVAGAVQGGPIGGVDAFVSKVNSTGTGLVFSTYLGGSGDENIFLAADNSEVYCGGIAIDDQRAIYVTGYTNSTNFPLVSPIQVVNSGNGDAFVTKLTPAGNQIVYSTYLGGRGRDAGFGIAVANAADGPNAYIVGETGSNDFNIANPYQQFNGGGVDAFVTRLNGAGSGMVYSTYLGGTGNDRGTAVAVGPRGDVFLTGTTLSNDFPVTAGAYAPNGIGSSDIFVTKLRDLGAQDDPSQLIEYSTYFGGSGENVGTAIAVDRVGNAYITGYTTSTDLPTVNPTVINGVYNGSYYGGALLGPGGLSDGFVAKFDPSKAGAESLVQATYLGGNGQDVATGIAVSPVNDDPESGDYVCYVTGWTTSTNFPTVAALRTSPFGGQDIFLSKIISTGNAFEYSTYLGGGSDDVGTGVAVDSVGRAYVVGATASNDYPVLVTGTSFNGGPSDNVITRLASPPAAPTELVGTPVSPTQIDLTWTDNSDNEGNAGGVAFQIERRQEGQAFQVVGFTGPNVNSFSDGLDPSFPLQPNTTYTYRVRSVNTVGSSAYSNAIDVTTFPVPPVAPSGLVLTALGQTSVRVDWADESDNETGFEIDRALESAPGSGIPGPFVTIHTTGPDEVTYTDNGLSTFTLYFYRVRAVNPGGPSAYVGPESVRTLDNPPAAPTSLSATTLSNTSIQLEWTDNADNEVNYEVQRSTGGGPFESVTSSLPADTEEFVDTGLIGNTTYTYRVRAINSGGPSGFSNTASAITYPNPPADPTDLIVTVPAAPAGITQLNLSWTDNSSNESGFKIERSTDNFADPGNTTLVTTTGANVSNYSDTGLEANTRYYYRVRATNLGGDSGNSNVASAVTLPNPPADPTGLVGIALSQTSVQLDWTDNSDNETGFIIERADDGVTFNQVGTVGAGVIQFVDTGLTAATEYRYRVLATNDGGNSAPSNTVVVTTLPDPPAAVTDLQALLLPPGSPYTLQVSLVWKDNSNNETGFKILRSTDGANFGQIQTVAAGTESYIDATVIPDTTYSYRIVATNAGGDAEPSNTATVTTPPAAPSGLRLSGITNSQAQLFWNDNSNQSPTFKIERKVDGGVFSEIAVVPAGVTTYQDTGLTGDTTYVYRVRASNQNGDSDYSAEATGTTLPDPPAAPTDLVATASSQTGLVLSWTDNSNNETGFKIERSTDGLNFVQIATVAADTDSYADTALSIDTRYWYRVRAFNTGGDSAYSNTADARTFPAAPAGPTNLTVTVLSSTSLGLSWTSNSVNEDGFIIERSVDGGFTYTPLGTAEKGKTTYVDSTGSPNTTYFYRVAASNLGGTSGFSNRASGLTLPAAPTNVNATALPNGNVEVTWGASAGGADGYVVESQALDSNNPAFVEVGRTSGAVTRLVVTGLLPNRTFNYRVKAFNRSGSSEYSNVDSASTNVALISATLKRARLKGGKKTQLVVMLSGPAPAGGATVQLSVSGEGAGKVKVKDFLTVPAGQTTAKVAVKTKKVKRLMTATITASYGGAFVDAELTIAK